jgi:hypothetical protein
MNAAPARLALALFCLGVVVVAATIAWAALAPSSDSGSRAARTPTRSVVGAGSPLPMLQDVDPERLDVVRSSPSASPRPSTAPVRRVGDTVTYGDGWRVTLLTIGEHPLPAPGLFSQPKAGTRLVVVTFRFENGGKVGARADFYNFKLQHGDAIRTSASVCYVECPSDQLMSLDLGPGGSQVRWLRFSAAVGDTQLALVYERIGYREVVWNLS